MVDPDRPPDLFRASGGSSRLLFDMAAGLPVRNVFGVGDPDLHFIDGRWTMFVGGFTTGFAVRVFEARLPPGHGLDSDSWQLVTAPARPRRAVPLFRPPRFGAWDSHGTHTPSYVRADTDHGPVERIYYAGRSTVRNGGPRSRYSIGVAELCDGRWHRRPVPVLTGNPSRRSVFEPLVRYGQGRYRMWFQWAPHEIARGEQPHYQLCYTESRSGLDQWTPPRVVFDEREGFFDNTVIEVDDHHEMLLARGSNLYGTRPFPDQGIWWVRASTHSASRQDWTAIPRVLLDAEADPPHWLAHGAFGPDFRYGTGEHDDATMYVFTSGTSAAPPWFAQSLARLRRRQLPRVPAPFTLSIGRLTIPDARRSLNHDAAP